MHVAGFGTNNERRLTLDARRACRIDVSVDHMVFGTDAPPLKSLKREGVQLIRDLKLSAADERKVYYENAKKLLKI